MSYTEYENGKRQYALGVNKLGKIPPRVKDPSIMVRHIPQR